MKRAFLVTSAGFTVGLITVIGTSAAGAPDELAAGAGVASLVLAVLVIDRRLLEARARTRIEVVLVVAALAVVAIVIQGAKVDGEGGAIPAYVVTSVAVLLVTLLSAVQQRRASSVGVGKREDPARLS